MYLTLVALVPAAAGQAARVDPQLLIDALWAIASTDARIEHISVQAGTARVDVGLYLKAESQIDGSRTARALLETAAESVPILRGWQIHESR